MKIANIFMGVFLLIIGILSLLSNFNIFSISFHFIWPLFLIIPGLFFELSYLYSKKNIAYLIPGAILIIYGLFFHFNILTNWIFINKLWPIFIMAIGIGFLQIHFLNKKEPKSLLIGIVITALSLLSIIILTSNLNFTKIFPIILIVLGLYFVVKRPN